MNESYNQKTKWKAFLFAMMNFTSFVILFILCSSLTKLNAVISVISPEQNQGINFFQIDGDNQSSAFYRGNEFFTAALYQRRAGGDGSDFLQEIFTSFKDSTGIQAQNSGYFRKVFYGNGLDHMNINLVEINLSGLKTGDEIGIFDGNYCVGSSVIEEQNLQDNNLSIAASANDTIESSPNGYIEGHNITLQAYRNGIVYQLFFQLVNDSQDIFERRASMFVLVDFSKSQVIAEP